MPFSSRAALSRLQPLPASCPFRRWSSLAAYSLAKASSLRFPPPSVLGFGSHLVPSSQEPPLLGAFSFEWRERVTTRMF